LRSEWDDGGHALQVSIKCAAADYLAENEFFDREAATLQIAASAHFNLK
jgi:hypothetical protein